VSHMMNCNTNRIVSRDNRGRDRMVVGLITNYVISAYHH